MGLQIRFDTNEMVELDEDNYENCHQFSRAVFLKMAPDTHKYKEALRQAVNDTGGITAVYAQMIEQGDAIRFEAKDCAAIPSGNLIIFVDKTGLERFGKMYIQHSMIAIGRDCWTGANNLNSLGASDTKVQNYVNVSQWREKLEKYVLYHIPF